MEDPTANEDHPISMGAPSAAEARLLRKRSASIDKGLKAEEEKLKKDKSHRVILLGKMLAWFN